MEGFERLIRPTHYREAQGWGQAFSPVIVQPPPSSHALSVALRQMKASTGRIPDYQPSGTSA
jgi:hypothetical protein